METTGARPKGWHPNALFLALFFWVPALGCLWMLLARFTGFTGGVGGWAWLYGSLAAPWMLLFGGGALLLAALWHYWQHRKAAETIRREGALRIGLPTPLFIRRYARLGLAGLMISGLVLAPRHLPVGGLLIKQQAEIRITRAKDGRQIGAPARILHCRYVSLDGTRQERFEGAEPEERCSLVHWWRP